MTLLFIEDNEDILLNLFEWFEAKGFACDCARTGPAGLELAMSEKFDCIVLDLMLPGMHGLDVCKKLRASGNHTPIIMLTAMDATADKINGLDGGADDYLVKPFALKELEARIRAVCRRGKAEQAELRFGPLILNRQTHRAWREGGELRLSPAAFKILELLLSEAPNLVKKEQLETLLWPDDPPMGSALRNHIHELRKVIDKPYACSMLETVPHVGWRLRLP